MTWLFNIANQVYFLVHRRLLFDLFLVATFLNHLQGALNVLIYIMCTELFSKSTKKQSSKKQNKKESDSTNPNVSMMTEQTQPRGNTQNQRMINSEKVIEIANCNSKDNENEVYEDGLIDDVKEDH